MHEFVYMNVVYCKNKLIKNIESQLLRDGFMFLQKLKGVFSLKVLGDDIIVGVVLEHFVHFNDIWMVLSQAKITICLRI